MGEDAHATADREAGGTNPLIAARLFGAEVSLIFIVRRLGLILCKRARKNLDLPGFPGAVWGGEGP